MKSFFSSLFTNRYGEPRLWTLVSLAFIFVFPLLLAFMLGGGEELVLPAILFILGSFMTGGAFFLVYQAYEDGTFIGAFVFSCFSIIIFSMTLYTVYDYVSALFGF